MSPNREDYIKIMFELEALEGYSTNKGISQGLGVAPASVTEMIRKLKKKKLVVAQGQKLFLTEEGSFLAKDLLSRHRLWETFLVEKLHYRPSDVHDMAEILEHVSEETFMEKLNVFLGKPKYCPHGGEIYRNGGILPKKTKNLFEVESHTQGRILRIYDIKDTLKKIEEMGLELYDMVEVEEKDEATIVLSFHEHKQKIPKDLAEAILIEEV